VLLPRSTCDLRPWQWKCHCQAWQHDVGNMMLATCFQAATWGTSWYLCRVILGAQPSSAVVFLCGAQSMQLWCNHCVCSDSTPSANILAVLFQGYSSGARGQRQTTSPMWQSSPAQPAPPSASPPSTPKGMPSCGSTTRGPTWQGRCLRCGPKWMV